MIIDHQKSKSLVRSEFEKNGKVERYAVEIDPDKIHSPWTRLPSHALATQVTDNGKIVYLINDEMDDYARNHQVSGEQIISKTLHEIISNPEKLPDVGHEYRKVREQDELKEQVRAQREAFDKKSAEAKMNLALRDWSDCVEINDRYINIFDLSMGRDKFIEDRIMNRYRHLDIRLSQEPPVMPISRMLAEYEKVAGHAFVANLKDDDTPQNRLKALKTDVESAIFVEKHGFGVKSVMVEATPTENASMRVYLMDRQDYPTHRISIEFEKSSAYANALTSPYVDSVSDMLSERELSVDSSLSTAIERIVADRLDYLHFIDDDEIVPLERRQHRMDLEEDYSAYDTVMVDEINNDTWMRNMMADDSELISAYRDARINPEHHYEQTGETPSSEMTMDR